MPRTMKLPEPRVIEVAENHSLVTPAERERFGAYAERAKEGDDSDRTFYADRAAADRAAADRASAARIPTPDPGIASNVVGAHALIEHEAELLRNAAAHEVQASKDRVEKALAAVWAYDSPDNQKALESEQLKMLAAPAVLQLAEAGFKEVRALKPLAEECDQLIAAGSSPAAFRVDLAKHMQEARKHLDAAMSEFVAAFALHKEHEDAGRAASAKRTKLSGKLTAIRRSFELRPKLPYGFGRMASWSDVTQAAAQAVIDAIEGSSLGNALASDLRARIKWQ